MWISVKFWLLRVYFRWGYVSFNDAGSQRSPWGRGQRKNSIICSNGGLKTHEHFKRQVQTTIDIIVQVRKNRFGQKKIIRRWTWVIHHRVVPVWRIVWWIAPQAPPLSMRHAKAYTMLSPKRTKWLLNMCWSFSKCPYVLKNSVNKSPCMGVRRLFYVWYCIQARFKDRAWGGFAGEGWPEAHATNVFNTTHSENMWCAYGRSYTQYHIILYSS